MYKIGSMPKSIPIGYTGETNFRKIEIDMNAWLDKMPDGVPSIVHVRPGESKTDAYVAVTEFDRETGILSWTITAADIGTLEGEGEMQVWLEETENDTVNKRGKSVIVKTKAIEAANDPDENVPTSQEAFLEQVTSLKTQTVTAKEAAEDAQAAAEDAQEAAEQAAEDAENVNLHPAYIDETTKNWMVYDAANHEYVDTQIKAQGEDGQDGQDGQDATPTLVCPAYADLTFPVTKDTLCYKDGTLYKAKQDISTSEAWTAAHWDATNLATEQRLLKNDIQGLDDANIRYSSLLGENNAQNIEYTGGSGNVPIIKFNTKANAQYVISIELEQSVSKTVYYSARQPDGTIIGYDSSIPSGDTFGVKTITVTDDYVGAYIAIGCTADCKVKSIKVVSSFNLLNEIAEGFVGDDITELSYTATNQKYISGSGVVTDSSDTTYYVTDEIEIIGNRWYQIMAAAGYSSTYYVIYDKNHNIIDYMRAPGGSATPIINKMVFSPSNAKYIRLSYITNVAVGHIALCNSLKPRTARKPSWLDKFLTIGYSSIGVAATNSIETYLSVGHFGFNACKGDVRPTSDGKLIMCHDPGFTFDGNGRITTYNASSRTLIHSLTHAQCMELEYAERATATENNHYQKVADIDGYLDVCKQYDMIAFVTVRDEYINDVVHEVVAALKRHNMTERAIINGYTVETNCWFRFLNDAIPISFVLSDDANITDAIINRTKPYGNAILTAVSSSIESYLENQKTQIEKAKTKGIYVMFAQPTTMEKVYFCRELGISGVQIGRPCLPYSMEQVKFKVKLQSGTPSIVEYEDIQTIDATLSVSGNVISISEFKIPGSTRGFPDLIMEHWMNRFAKRITVESENGNAVTAKWQNNALKITVSDISVNDTIDVIIEV